MEVKSGSVSALHTPRVLTPHCHAMHRRQLCSGQLQNWKPLAFLVGGCVGERGGVGGSGILSAIQKPPVLLQPMPVPCDARCHSCTRH